MCFSVAKYPMFEEANAATSDHLPTDDNSLAILLASSGYTNCHPRPRRRKEATPYLLPYSTPSGRSHRGRIHRRHHGLIIGRLQNESSSDSGRPTCYGLKIDIESVGLGLVGGRRSDGKSWWHSLAEYPGTRRTRPCLRQRRVGW